ncbi:hypothetical protein V8F06_012997 [Rhypophila decipiens]
MARRPVRRASRAAGSSARPAPIPPTPSTPVSSAYPSTYASEAELDDDNVVSQLPLHALTLSEVADHEAAAELAEEEKAKAAAKKKQPFRYMDLPSELRIKILGYYFADVGPVVDLDTDNWKRIHKKLGILRTSRAMYFEASHFFYGSHTFRLFPTVGKFFKAKKPLLARLNKRQRGWITSLELRLGPGWNRPPRGWVVNDALGLVDCVSLRNLTVFVECDPSDNVFNGFRRADGFYEKFSRDLLVDVLAGLPFLDRIYFDAWTSVKKSGAMMRGLFEVTAAKGRKICWGPERGWTDQDEVEPPKVDFNHTGIPNTIMNSVGISLMVVA